MKFTGMSGVNRLLFSHEYSMMCRKKILMYVSLVVSLVTALILSPALQAQTDSLDSIVVTVNGYPITETEVQSRLRLMRFEALQSGAALPPTEEAARSQAIDHAISQRVKRQEAEFRGIVITNQDVFARFQDIAFQNQLQPDALLAIYEGYGLTSADVILSLQETLMDETLISAVLAGRVTVREEEVDRYLAANESEFDLSEQYHLTVIVVPDSEEMNFATKRRFRQIAEQVTDEMNNGTEFESIVEAIVGVEGVNAGELGWIGVEDIEPEVLVALSNAKVGSQLGPIKAGDTLIFLKLNDHRQASQADLPEVNEYHLARFVLYASNQAGAEVIVGQLEDYRSSIIEGADFGSLTKLYSHDSTTRPDGGDMGWISEDNLPYEFIEPLSTMQPGDVSEVQNFGTSVFIFELRGVRTGDLEVRKRSYVRNILRNLKLRNESVKWVDQLRSAATIKFRSTFGS